MVMVAVAAARQGPRDVQRSRPHSGRGKALHGRSGRRRRNNGGGGGGGGKGSLLGRGRGERVARRLTELAKKGLRAEAKELMEQELDWLMGKEDIVECKNIEGGGGEEEEEEEDKLMKKGLDGVVKALGQLDMSDVAVSIAEARANKSRRRRKDAVREENGGGGGRGGSSFEAMCTADVATFSGLMYHVVLRRGFSEGLGVVRKMEALGVVPDTVFFNEALKGCCRWTDAQLLLALMHEKQLAPNLRTYTSLASTAARDKNCEATPDDIILLLEDPQVPPDTPLINSVLHALGELDYLREAEGIYEEMEERFGCAPSKHTLSIMFRVLGNAGKLGQAFELFRQTSKYDHLVSTTAANELIHACNCRGRIESAMEVLVSMRKLGIAPDAITYTLMLNACGGERRHDLAVTVVEMMEEQEEEEPTSRVVRDARLANALVYAFATVGDWEAAIRHMKEAEALRLPVTGLSRGRVVRALVRSSRHLHAFREFRVLCKDERITETAIFRSLMRSCSLNRDADNAARVLGYMEQVMVNTDNATWSYALDALGNEEDRWQIAAKLMARKRSEGKELPRRVLVAATKHGPRYALAMGISEETYRINMTSSMNVY